MTDRAEPEHRKDMYARGWAAGLVDARAVVESAAGRAEVLQKIDRLLAEHRASGVERWK